MFNNNNKNAFHILPELFQEGSEDNNDAKEILGALGFGAAIVFGACQVFEALTELDKQGNILFGDGNKKS